MGAHTLAMVDDARPIVVTLCGSTRFYDQWQEAIYQETMAGRIVLSVGFYPHAVEFAHAQHVGCTPEQKVKLDALHMKKIDMSDEILVLNVGGYIGESTRNEIAHAEATGKRIRYLELQPLPPLRWCQHCGDDIGGQGRRICAMCKADIAEREEHRED